MQFSQDQQNALDAYEATHNLFLTGPGGSGKSALIKHMVNIGEKNGKIVQVCALTGCAAVLLECSNAKTIHSWAGIGIGSGNPHDIISRVVNNKHKRANWNKPNILIIDEISMMSAKLFDLLDVLGRKCRNNNSQPFGGLQVVFSGDFYQLPPIGDENDPGSNSFCFESIRWNHTFDSIVQLKTIFRQTDNIYAKILNQIRVGKLSKKSYNYLANRVIKHENHITEENIKPTILLPRRLNVDRINMNEFNKLEGNKLRYRCTIVNKLPISNKKIEDINTFPISVEMIEAEIKYLRTNIMAEQEIELVIGTQVMCVANLDMEGSHKIVNGSQGIVTDFCQGYPVVLFKDNQKRIIKEHTWNSENIPGLGIKQIPLIYSWAITIHKSQGVTLDLAEIDAGTGIFECGQTYVALSRVKSLEGLYLTKFDPQKIKINRKVREFYASIN